MADARSAGEIDSPECIRCGAFMRIIAMEPHPQILHADLRTFRCDACDETQIVFVPFVYEVPPVRLSTSAEAS